jgi:hypothetical protein
MFLPHPKSPETRGRGSFLRPTLGLDEGPADPVGPLGEGQGTGRPMKVPFLLCHVAGPGHGDSRLNWIGFPWLTGWLCSLVQIFLHLTPQLAACPLSDLDSLMAHQASALAHRGCLEPRAG